MPVLVDPVPAPASRLLRAAVLDLRRRGRRQGFPPTLNVGMPAGPWRSFAPAHAERLDEPLCADVVSALLARRDHGTPAIAWVARSGPLSWHDADARWLAPTLRAFAEAGTEATFVVVTREGWWDPRSGTVRVWRRLRARS